MDIKELLKILVKEGASIGANATIVCGHDIGEFAFIGAGAVITKEVKAYALVVGNPARQIGWVCACGTKLSLTTDPDSKETAKCPKCGREYKKEGNKVEQI